MDRTVVITEEMQDEVGKALDDLEQEVRAVLEVVEEYIDDVNIARRRVDSLFEKMLVSPPPPPPNYKVIVTVQVGPNKTYQLHDPGVYKESIKDTIVRLGNEITNRVSKDVGDGAFK